MFDDDLMVIRDAITNLRQLAFDTTDDDGITRHRIVCPHILGTKRGNWHLFTWQINDESKHGFAPGGQRWRCFELRDMSNIKSQEGQWYQGWTKGLRDQSCVDSIDTIVDAAHSAEVLSTSRAHIR